MRVGMLSRSVVTDSLRPHGLQPASHLLYKVPVSRWFSKRGWFWTAAADGSLLEMQILGFHPRPTLSETLAVGPSDLFQHHVQVIFFFT